MKALDEKFLVRKVVGLINRLGIKDAGLIPEFSFFEEQVKRSYYSRICSWLEGMSNAELGVIVGLRLPESDRYDKARFLQTPPVWVVVDSTILRSGRDQLTKLAVPVVIAAMYDIMMTKYVSGEVKKELRRNPKANKFSKGSPYTYWPKRALYAYVLPKHRRVRKKSS